LEEIVDRTSPARIKERTTEHVRTHPLGWGAGAFATGFLSSLFLVRKFKEARQGW
jgi:hypothetical protein